MDFTLHDAEHSFRVAQRMTELIPPDVLPKLQAYELSLLLLSAYLHDIGMTPERKKVSGHYEYLLLGKQGDLSSSDIETFQTWLDDEGEGIVPPLTTGQVTAEILHKAQEIIIYYCRYQHNDWSEEWIRTHLASEEMGTYATWLDDLVALCRSHHYGYAELHSDRFDPRIVGNPAQVVNLRYLAMILRVADVLEFDPERTPEVLLRHREISAGSLIFWWKDRQISFALDKARVIISARPTNAHIHRAIEKTIEQVDMELRVCKTLADSLNFEKCPGLATALPHHWDISPSVFQDVQPSEGNYEYIDGSFRPDTRRLLELLSGTELYGNPFVAVRELLQNAFDAVREQIAYTRLTQPNPSDPKLETTLQELHTVNLRLEPHDDGFVLICSDNGVGMTKNVIRDHLLVSGSSRRHDILDLERRSQVSGFSVGRTGEFGIGVLSYFMLAKRVIIKTKRSQESGDAEPTAWQFETEGVGSFGELRKTEVRTHGTEVILYLRADVLADDARHWYESLFDYLAGVLIRVPCSVTITSALPNTKRVSIRPGWALGENEKASYVTRNVSDPYSHRQKTTPMQLLPQSLRRQIEEEEHHWQEVLSEFQARIRFLTTEGDLPSGLGKYRIHLFYFDLPGGPSLKFLKVNETESRLVLSRISTGYCTGASVPVRVAWKGMRTSLRMEQDHRYYGIRHLSLSDIALIEVDLTSFEGGKISVNRIAFNATETGTQAMKWVFQKAKELAVSFARENHTSKYAWLNKRTLDPTDFVPKEVHWLLSEDQGADFRVSWATPSFPLVSASAFAYRWKWGDRRKVLWKGSPVCVAPCLGEPTDDDPYDGQVWNSPSAAPDRILTTTWGPHYWGFGMAPLWLRKPSSEPHPHPAGLTSSFPPNWRHICSVRLDRLSEGQGSSVIWNRSHPLIRQVEPNGWDWCSANFSSTLDPLPVRDALLQNQSRAASWVIRCLEEEGHELWGGLLERDPNFLEDLWNLLSLPTVHTSWGRVRSVLQWVDSSNPRLRELSPKGWLAHKWPDAKDKLNELLPKVGPEWILEVRSS